MEMPRLSSIILPLTILVSFTSFALSLLPEALQTLDISSETCSTTTDPHSSFAADFDDLSKSIFSKITADPAATLPFATDFGNLSKSTPASVFYPSSPDDIAALIRFSYTSPKPFPISQRGAGHSMYGQTFVPDGVLIDMSSLGRGQVDCRITVVDGPVPYADAGGEQLWIDVVNAALKHGLMPRILTDYLYPTIGGTLSNAGISARVFRHGPQISNVYELDVITGTGETVTCSKEMNSDLYYAALGGLGQFGVITRARIALEPARKTARWLRLFYTDMQLVMKDQEKLITIENDLSVFDFVGGEVVLSVSKVAALSAAFKFSDSDREKVTQLVAEYDGPVYFIDAVAFYDETTAPSLDQNIKSLLEELHYISGFAFSFDMPLFDFLNRIYYQELARRPLGLWLVPHPWLDLFVPKSKVLEFKSRIFEGILSGTTAAGPILIFPMSRTKWDDNMSAVTPNEEVFYAVSLLWSAIANDSIILTELNNEVVNICEKYNLGCKKYLPRYTHQKDWQKHYGEKWNTFVSRKRKYDPKALLSPGQKIFTPLELN